MGIDGWIYIAGGDFGFMNAKGTDGRELQHRGGGVIRFRPDGSGLELFATGTRNILGTPMSPLLDLFARDNTNDGGGWDVRFHHFTGLEDHGYPRLYKNFGDEHVAPLADYGGGSGCGSVYIHEPGFPDEWKNAPFTCDWGKNALFHHAVQRKGATFEEITEPQPFIKMTRPTDADVDGMSAVYQASWKGATFKWEGPDVGYIVRVTPKDYQPRPLPDFEKMSDLELVAALESPSHIRTLAAQRALLRREEKEETTEALVALVGSKEKDLAARVAALFAMSQRGLDPDESIGVLTKLVGLADESDNIAPFAVRAFGDLGLKKNERLARDFVGWGLELNDPHRKVESMIAAARQNLTISAVAITSALDDPDPIVAHTAFQALAKLNAHEAAFAALDSGKKGAAFALMRMHDPVVVDGLISRLQSEKRPEVRQLVLAALCRLYQREAEWKGDSWGTRPDTRGPYYQPETWEQSERILIALKSALDAAEAGEAAFIVKEMSRNRIQSNDAMNSILSLAKKNRKVIPDAVTQLAASDSIPPEGVEILLSAAKSDGEEFGFPVIASAVTALAKTDSKEGFEASLSALGNLQGNITKMEEAQKAIQQIKDPIKQKSEGKYARTNLGKAKKLLEEASRGFLKSAKLENHHLALEEHRR